MPFSAKLGFYQDQIVSGGTIWYNITGSEWLTEASNFTGNDIVANNIITVSAFGGSDFRYRGGCLHPNGNIYYAPRSVATGMLEFEPSTGTSNYITDGPLGTLSGGTPNFHSCILTEQGNILCIPFSYTKIIEYSPDSGTATEYGSFSGSAKWSGGILGQNGNVYCVPQNYNGVLEIDPSTSTTTTHTYGITMSGTVKWWGGYRSPKDDRMYMAPLRYGSVLVIAPDGQSADTKTYGLTFDTDNTNDHYGVCGDKFGNVVLIRGDEGTNKCINPDNNTGFEFGFALSTYGGVTGADGNVYTVSKGTNTRKFDMSSGNTTIGEDTVYTVATPNRMAGIQALNGNIYISPDQNSTDMLELDIGANISISNMDNLILSPYLKTDKI